MDHDPVDVPADVALRSPSPWVLQGAVNRVLTLVLSWGLVVAADPSSQLFLA
jgi:hypothetical protein